MHPNPIFHDADAARNLDYARAIGFGTLVVNGSEAPLLSHVPVVLSEEGGTVDLHLVRSNPTARALKAPLAARIAVTGPDAYVSPDWYEIPDQVPTWNYVAVHLTGTLELLPQANMHDMLDRQSAFYEVRLLPKDPWITAKMVSDVLEKMMRQIVPCRMIVTGVDGTWKLSQNKPDTVRLSAAEQMEAVGFGIEPRVIGGFDAGRRPAGLMAIAQSRSNVDSLRNSYA